MVGKIRSPVQIDDAAATLQSAYAQLAASEALTRALVCERTEKSIKADFWVKVYLSIRRSAEISNYPSAATDTNKA